MDLTFYSGLEHMTILGHQQGSPNMLAPLRTHCAASVLSELLIVYVP